MTLPLSPMLFRICCFILCFAVPLRAPIVDVRPTSYEVDEEKKDEPRRASKLYKVTICQGSIECCDWIYGARFKNRAMPWWNSELGFPIQAIALHPGHPGAWTLLGLREHPRRSQHVKPELNSKHEPIDDPNACKHNHD